MNYHKHVYSVFGIVIMAALAVGSLEDGGQSTTSTPGTTKPDRADKIQAWVMTQQFVEQRLKSPSTANFGSILKGTYQSPEDCVTDLGGGRFRSVGWVDSQNAFGATIRTHFVCELKYVGGGKWQLESFDVRD